MLNYKWFKWKVLSGLLILNGIYICNTGYLGKIYVWLLWNARKNPNRMKKKNFVESSLSKIFEGDEYIENEI